MSKKKYDVTIIGGGHNGLVAATYLAKAGKSVVILEANPEIEHILSTQRNLLWVTKLNNLLQKHDTLFIVVGAGHLPGDSGLLNLLKMQGFMLETPL